MHMDTNNGRIVEKLCHNEIKVTDTVLKHLAGLEPNNQYLVLSKTSLVQWRAAVLQDGEREEVLQETSHRAESRVFSPPLDKKWIQFR